MDTFDFDLNRFVTAQAPVMPAVLGELRAGKKETHWMWFIFPQLRSLGRSDMARYYGLASRAEALAYYQHPGLRTHLMLCSALLVSVQGKTALEILGHPDDEKLQACMTLFAEVAPDVEIFRTVLDRYFDGAHHAATLHDLAFP
jgi:uncharacterized protein (DUF1810 family)